MASRKNVNNRVIVFCISILFTLLSYPVFSTRICVSNNFDSGPGSLRSAIAIANAASGDTLDCTLITGQTIGLASQLPNITSSMVIQGANAGFTIDAGAVGRVFTIVTATGTVVLNNITMQNGKTSGGEPGANGGAINSSAANLVINNCIMKNNASGGRGGGLYVGGGTTTLNNCIVTNNTSTNEGGGISTEENAIVNINYTTISNNTAPINGGGVDGNSGTTISISNSTISNNTSGTQGGAVSTAGVSFSVTNSTIFGNSSVNNGGACSVDPPSTFTNCTFMNNTCSNGPGGALLLDGTSSVITNTIFIGNQALGTMGAGGAISGSCVTLTLNASIIAGNTQTTGPQLNNGSTPSSCLLLSTTGGNQSDAPINYWSPTAVTTGNVTTITAASVTTGALANNGGPAQTVALKTGSPAIDGGTASGAPSTDERTVPRTCGIDVGAYQMRRFPFSITPNITSLCGQNTPLTLSSGLSASYGRTFKWYLNGAPIAGATGPTYNITSYTPGTYKVLVDSSLAGCYEYDTITLTASLPQVSITPRSYDLCTPLGLNLCNPTSYNLASSISGAGYTYQWQYGSTYGSLANIASTKGGTSQTYTVNTAGVYRLIVSAAGCGSTSDTISVTTGTATPVNANFCPPPSASVSLSVTGTGNYEWFTASTGGLPIAKGTTSYTTPVLSATTTYYVSDTTLYSSTAGKPTSSSCDNTNSWSENFGQDADLLFNVTNPNGVYIYQITVRTAPPGGPCCCSNPSWTMKVNIRNSAITGFPKTVSATMACNSTLQTINLGGIFLPQGNGYQLDFGGTSSNVELCPNASYPLTYSPNIVITGNNAGNQNYLGAYNWVLKAEQTCARVPVIAIACTPQPIKLISFNASPEGRDVLLTWKTATEVNSSYYNLQRSYDGIDFTTIGEVKAAGNSASELSYQYTDVNPSKGLIYYRLVEYDLNGDSTVSAIRSVNLSGDFTVLLFPNPFSDETKLKFYSPTLDDVSLQIYDVTGTEVYSATNISTNAVLTIGKTLTSGFYTVRVTAAQAIVVLKMVKTN